MAKEYIEREAAKKEFNLYFGSVSHAVIANRILDELPAAEVFELTDPCIRQLFYAVYALADMVNQFGYKTTFRKQEAVCDGGLSALEEAFAALNACGCRANSNWTISRKHLWEFMETCLHMASGERKDDGTQV